MTMRVVRIGVFFDADSESPPMCHDVGEKYFSGNLWAKTVSVT